MAYTGTNTQGYNNLINLGYNEADATNQANATKANPNFYPQFQNDNPVAAGNPNYSGGVRQANGQDAIYQNGKLISIDGQPFTPPALVSGGSGSTSGTVANPSINGKILQPSTALQLPTQSTPSNLTNTLIGNNTALASGLASMGYSLDNNGQYVQTAQKSPNDAASDYFKAFTNYVGAPPSTNDIYNQLQNETGIQQKQSLVSSLTGQLNGIVAKSQADQLQLRQTGSQNGVTEAVYGGQQATISREAAIAALPVQAQLSAAQGDLQMAQEHFDTLFKIRSDDAQNQYKYRSDLFKSVYDIADKAEQRRLDALQHTADQNHGDLQLSIKRANDLADSYTQNNDLKSATALGKLVPPVDPASPTFKADLAKYNAAIAKVQAGAKPDALRAAQISHLYAETAKLNAESAGVSGATDPALMIAYAQQYASDGKIPTGMPKGTFGIISALAKEFPKPNGTLVDINTGVKSNKFNATEEQGVNNLYDLTKKLNDLNTVYKSTGIMSTNEDRQHFYNLRGEVVDLIARARTGAAITESEERMYTAKLPELFNVGSLVHPIKLFSGQYTEKVGEGRITDLKSSLEGKLNTILRSNGLSMYGYTKIKDLTDPSIEYTVGQTVQFKDGTKARVNADGSATLIQ